MHYMSILSLSNVQYIFFAHPSHIIHIFDSDFVWQMLLMIYVRLKIYVVCLGNFQPLMLIN